MNGYTIKIGITVTMEIVYLITFPLIADFKTASLTDPPDSINALKLDA